MLKNDRSDGFERKGGYPSARGPRTDMKPPLASASQPAKTNNGSRPGVNRGSN